MDVTPLVKEGAQIIQSYDGGRFRVSGKVYEHPVIVTQTQTVQWNVQADGVSALRVDDFEQVIAMCDSVDVMLLGCGARLEFLPAALKNALKERGVSVDVMDTGAACRTYNVLMAEGRRVAAVLFLY